MSTFEICRATSADAKEIGLLRAADWQEQYAHLDGVTAEWMAKKVEDLTGETGVRNRAYWIAESHFPGAKNYWLVARLLGNGAFAGFVEARKHPNGTQELCSLHAKQRGAGIGQALINHAHEWLDPSGDTFVDVAEPNVAGQRFYAREPNNYRFTGHEYLFGPIRMLRMLRQVRK